MFTNFLNVNKCYQMLTNVNKCEHKCEQEWTNLSTNSYRWWQLLATVNNCLQILTNVNFRPNYFLFFSATKFDTSVGVVVVRFSGVFFLAITLVATSFIYYHFLWYCTRYCELNHRICKLGEASKMLRENWIFPNAIKEGWGDPHFGKRPNYFCHFLIKTSLKRSIFYCSTTENWSYKQI